MACYLQLFGFLQLQLAGFVAPILFKQLKKPGQKPHGQIPQQVSLYGSNRVSQTVTHGISHGISDFHLHLLFWCSVSMADHRDHATQLHPTQDKDVSVVITNHSHVHILQKYTIWRWKWFIQC